MTSCPSEQELVELVDGALDAERGAAVVDHLAECADCRSLLARHEAALRLALGGLADAARAAPPVRKLHAWPRVAAAAALVVAAGVAAIAFHGAHPATQPESEAPLLARLEALRETVRRCAETPRAAPRDDVDAIAAAADDARAALGLGGRR